MIRSVRGALGARAHRIRLFVVKKLLFRRVPTELAAEFHCRPGKNTGAGRTMCFLCGRNRGLAGLYRGQPVQMMIAPGALVQMNFVGRYLRLEGFSIVTGS